jgi:hypothetical protein
MRSRAAAPTKQMSLVSALTSRPRDVFSGFFPRHLIFPYFVYSLIYLLFKIYLLFIYLLFYLFIYLCDTNKLTALFFAYIISLFSYFIDIFNCCAVFVISFLFSDRE